MSLGNTRIFDNTFGVIWMQAAGELLFTEIQNNRLWRWRPGVATGMGFDVVRSGIANGQDVLGLRAVVAMPDASIVTCESVTHRVTRSAMGYNNPVVLADRWPGGAGTPAGQFNAPYDAVVRRDGTIYFSDPVTHGKSPDLAFAGLYRIDPAGRISLETKDLTDPWGLALSADQGTLFVSTGDHSIRGGLGIYKFPVNPDGSLGARTLFASGALAGPPGGLCTDQAGNLYHTANAMKVFRPDGTLVNTNFNIPFPVNCTFGEADGKTMFLSAGDVPPTNADLWRVRLNIPGVP
jgi:gluconolactonase